MTTTDPTTLGTGGKPWLSVAEFAAELGLDKGTVYRNAKSGRIPNPRMTPAPSVPAPGASSEGDQR